MTVKGLAFQQVIVNAKTRSKRPLNATLLLLVFIALWLFRGFSAPVIAQGTDWEDPVNISRSPNDSWFPSITVDPTGQVHLVWCEDFDDTRCASIYYARYDGNRWTIPIDIFIAREEDKTFSPVIKADPWGMLHMVWIGGNETDVMYSQAQAAEADSALAWTTPVSIAGPVLQLAWPDLFIDEAGNLHVVYRVATGEQSGIYYVHSSDQGLTWSDPVAVFSNYSSSHMVDQSRLAVGDEGDIHVTWTENALSEGFPPVGVRYSRSLDGGLTWSWPLAIDGPFVLTGIATVGQQVHLIWSGTGEQRHKFHQWSPDRGATWSEAQITAQIGGFEGWPGLVVDSAGHVHALQAWGSGQEDEVLGHAVWADGSWSPQTVLIEPLRNLPRDILGTGASITEVDAAVGLGNNLHVVAQRWTEYVDTDTGWKHDIYYFAGHTDAPRLEAQVQLQPTAQTLPTQASAITSTSTPASSEEPPSFPVAAPSSPGFWRDPILIALIPVLALVFIVIMHGRLNKGP